MKNRHYLVFLLNLTLSNLSFGAVFHNNKEVESKKVLDSKPQANEGARISMENAIDSARSKSRGKFVEGALVEDKSSVYKLLMSEKDKSNTEIEVDATTGEIIKIERNL